MCVCSLCVCRWLQPDRSVDPDASSIEVVTPPAEMEIGKKIECVVQTKDQNGKDCLRGRHDCKGISISTCAQYNKYMYTVYKYTDVLYIKFIRLHYFVFLNKYTCTCRVQ